MKLLQKANVMAPEECAAALLDTVPLVMSALRVEFRRHHPVDLTVAQFRTLALIHLHPGASLTTAAETIGLSISAMSRLVTTLEQRGYIDRGVCRDNRRQAQLALTAAGEATLKKIKRLAQSHVARILEGLSDDERATVTTALELLQVAFRGKGEAHHA